MSSKPAETSAGAAASAMRVSWRRSIVFIGFFVLTENNLDGTQARTQADVGWL